MRKKCESNMTTLDGNPAAKLVYLQNSDAEPKKVLHLEQMYMNSITMSPSFKK